MKTGMDTILDFDADVSGLHSRSISIYNRSWDTTGAWKTTNGCVGAE